MSANTIILNASGTALYYTGPTGGFFVAPIQTTSVVGQNMILGYGPDKQIIGLTGDALAQFGIGSSTGTSSDPFLLANFINPPSVPDSINVTGSSSDIYVIYNCPKQTNFGIGLLPAISSLNIIVGNTGTSNFTGFTGTIGNAGLSAAGRFNVYGNITMGTGMTTVGSAGNETAWQLLGTGTQLITSNGVAFSSPFDLGGTGSYSLQDAFVTSALRQITLGTGTLVTNGFNITCGTFNYNNATTKAMNFGTSTITILGGSSTSGFQGSNAGTTYTDVANSTIVFTSTSTTCFSGGQGGGTGNQFGTVTMSGLSGTLNIGAGGTVAKCTTLNNTVSPCTITNSCTTGFTVTNFNVDGTAGNLVTLNSATPGTARTISQATGTVDARYMFIKDSTATGGATWNASNSVAGPNNTGWNFLASTSRLRLVSTGIMYTVTAELNEVSSPNISMSLSNFNSTEFDEVGSPGVAMRYNNGNVVQVSTEFDEVTTIS
jgi:hypothetical protein